MSKRAILLLSVFAILLFIGGFVAYGIGTAAVLSCTNGASDSTSVANCASAGATPVLIGFALIGIGALLNLIAWIGGLIRTARASDWLWFVLILLFTPLTSLIYGFVGKDQPATSAPAM